MHADTELARTDTIPGRAYTCVRTDSRRGRGRGATSLRPPFLARFRLRLPGSGRAWCLLAGALALLASAGAAQAQTARKLAGTTSNTGSQNTDFNNDYAQAFTTGSHTDGYTLTRVEILMNSQSTAPTYSVKIHSDSSGSPGTVVDTLTNPSSPPTSGLAAYTHSGLDLAADTTYWLVRDVTASPTGTWSWSVHTSDNDDNNPVDGWSIADNSKYRASTATSWTDDTTTLRFNIYGYEEDASTLVKNLGQPTQTTLTSSFNTDHAQTFTTGGNALGYGLTNVGIRMDPLDTNRGAVYTVSIRSDSGGNPGTSVGTLTSPTLAAPEATYAHTARGNPIQLDASTTYWVMIDTTANGTSIILNTASDAEDSGAATGWSLGNTRRTRNWSVATWGTHQSDNVLKIDVEGFEADRLTISSVSVTNQPTGSTYDTEGSSIEVTVTFSAAATVEGTPRIELSPAFGPGGATRYATYVSGSGSKALVFRYNLAAGDDSGSTVLSVPANALDADGADGNASIRNGTVNATASHAAQSTSKFVSVPGGVVPPPPPPPPGPQPPPPPPPPPGPFAPGAPRSLTAVGGYGEVVLKWEAPASDGGAAITDYEYRIDRSHPWISTGSTGTTHTVSGLVSGTPTSSRCVR